MAPRPTHYEVLGVRPDATAEQIHRAYLDRARRHHPDVAPEGDSSSPDAGLAMAAVNEAWRVVGHPGRRRVYDASLRGDTIAASRPSARPTPPAGVRTGRFDDDPFAEPEFIDGDYVDVAPAGSAIMSALPWVVVLGLLAAIFVFTAFAAGGRDDAGDGAPSATTTDAPASHLGSCVVVTDGAVVSEVSCEGSNDGQVVAEVGLGQGCPTDTRPVIAAGASVKLCLAG